VENGKPHPRDAVVTERFGVGIYERESDGVRNVTVTIFWEDEQFTALLGPADATTLAKALTDAAAAIERGDTQ
jgi:hypothetical protein